MSEKWLLVSTNDNKFNALYFVSNVDTVRWNISRRNVEKLKRGENHPEYLKIWERILKTAYYITDDGCKWVLLEEDGNLYTVREGSK